MTQQESALADAALRGRLLNWACLALSGLSLASTAPYKAELKWKWPLIFGEGLLILAACLFVTTAAKAVWKRVWNRVREHLNGKKMFRKKILLKGYDNPSELEALRAAHFDRAVVWLTLALGGLALTFAPQIAGIRYWGYAFAFVALLGAIEAGRLFRRTRLTPPQTAPNENV